MLLITKSKSKPSAACCGGCAKGRPCCGSADRRRSPRWQRRPSGLLLPRRELLRPRAMLASGGYPTPHEWPGGRFAPGLPAHSVSFDMSCSDCCQQGCCPDGDPAQITATFTSGDCACWNYEIDMPWGGFGYGSDFYDDPCSDTDNTIISLGCDEMTGVYSFDKLTSAECSVNSTAVELLSCSPFHATLTFVLSYDLTPCTDCPEGSIIDVEFTE